MILTDDFVYIHLPKTGGTFVTEILTRLYSNRGNHWVQLLPEKIRAKYRKDFVILHDLKHSMCREIPISHTDKPILANVRSPYTRYISEYEFGWWKEHCPWDIKMIKELYPHFPDISFSEFYEILNGFALPPQLSRLGAGDVNNIGFQSRLFIEYFFREPAKIKSDYSKDPTNYQIDKADMYDVHFLRTESLNTDLFDALVGLGFQKDDLSFILDSPKIFPNDEGRRREKDKFEKYFSPELADKVRAQEHFIFQLFPEYDVY